MTVFEFGKEKIEPALQSLIYIEIYKLFLHRCNPFFVNISNYTIIFKKMQLYC